LVTYVSPGGLVTIAKLQAEFGDVWHNLRVEDTTYRNLRVALYNGGRIAETLSLAYDGLLATHGGVISLAALHGFNGTSWDRLRNDPNKHLAVTLGGLGNLAHGQVSVGTSATQIKAANTSRKAITIKNIGSETVYLGNSGVTTANGFPLEPGEGFGPLRTTAAIYGIVASGSGKVAYWEE